MSPVTQRITLPEVKVCWYTLLIISEETRYCNYKHRNFIIGVERSMLAKPVSKF